MYEYIREYKKNDMKRRWDEILSHADIYEIEIAKNKIKTWESKDTFPKIEKFSL